MGVRSHRVPATRGARARCRRSCEPPRVAHDITPVELVVAAVGLDSSRTHAEEEPAMTDLAWIPTDGADKAAGQCGRVFDGGIFDDLGIDHDGVRRRTSGHTGPAIRYQVFGRPAGTRRCDHQVATIPPG